MNSVLIFFEQECAQRSIPISQTLEKIGSNSDPTILFLGDIILHDDHMDVLIEIMSKSQSTKQLIMPKNGFTNKAALLILQLQKCQSKQSKEENFEDSLNHTYLEHVDFGSSTLFDSKVLQEIESYSHMLRFSNERIKMRNILKSQCPNYIITDKLSSSLQQVTWREMIQADMPQAISNTQGVSLDSYVQFEYILMQYMQECKLLPKLTRWQLSLVQNPSSRLISNLNGESLHRHHGASKTSPPTLIDIGRSMSESKAGWNVIDQNYQQAQDQNGGNGGNGGSGGIKASWNSIMLQNTPEIVKVDSNVESEWQEKFSQKHNRKYWKHASTGESTWIQPTGSGAADGIWEELYSRKHLRKYWRNVLNGDISWANPSVAFSSSISASQSNLGDVDTLGNDDSEDMTARATDSGNQNNNNNNDNSNSNEGEEEEEEDDSEIVMIGRESSSPNTSLTSDITSSNSPAVRSTINVKICDINDVISGDNAEVLNERDNCIDAVSSNEVKSQEPNTNEALKYITITLPISKKTKIINLQSMDVTSKSLQDYFSDYCSQVAQEGLFKSLATKPKPGLKVHTIQLSHNNITSLHHQSIGVGDDVGHTPRLLESPASIELGESSKQVISDTNKNSLPNARIKPLFDSLLFPCLTHLDLSFNHISNVHVNDIVNIFPLTLKILKLQRNNISILSPNLILLTNLTHLDLSHNAIKAIRYNLPHNLEELNLSHNQIHSEVSLRMLSLCSHLSRLTIDNNPLLEKIDISSGCRIRILDLIPSLITLNHSPVKYKNSVLLSPPKSQDKKGRVASAIYNGGANIFSERSKGRREKETAKSLKEKKLLEQQLQLESDARRYDAHNKKLDSIQRKQHEIYTNMAQQARVTVKCGVSSKEINVITARLATPRKVLQPGPFSWEQHVIGFKSPTQLALCDSAYDASGTYNYNSPYHVRRDSMPSVSTVVPQFKMSKSVKRPKSSVVSSDIDEFDVESNSGTITTCSAMLGRSRSGSGACGAYMPYLNTNGEESSKLFSSLYVGDTETSNCDDHLVMTSNTQQDQHTNSINDASVVDASLGSLDISNSITYQNPIEIPPNQPVSAQAVFQVPERAMVMPIVVANLQLDIDAVPVVAPQTIKSPRATSSFTSPTSGILSPLPPRSSVDIATPRELYVPTSRCSSSANSANSSSSAIEVDATAGQNESYIRTVLENLSLQDDDTAKSNELSLAHSDGSMSATNNSESYSESGSKGRVGEERGGRSNSMGGGGVRRDSYADAEFKRLGLYFDAASNSVLPTAAATTSSMSRSHSVRVAGTSSDKDGMDGVEGKAVTHDTLTERIEQFRARIKLQP